MAPSTSNTPAGVLDGAFMGLSCAPDDGTPLPQALAALALDARSSSEAAKALMQLPGAGDEPVWEAEDNPLSFSRRTSARSFVRNYSAVISRLPKGLSEAERARIAAASPLAPARSMQADALLQATPKIKQRSAEGQQLRRSALAGAVIAFVTAGYSGKRFVFEKAHELGVKAIVLDADDSWAQEMVGEGIISSFTAIDFSDADNVFISCLQAVKTESAKLGGLDGVCTFSEFAVPLTARLAEKLGVPGNSPEAVDQARDKYLTRAAMARAGMPTPRNMRIDCPDDIEPAGEHVGFPAVIKPVSGAASNGVIRVNTMDELRAAYKRVAAELTRIRYVAGWLAEEEEDAADTSTSVFVGGKDSWFNVQLMLEEYMDGVEVDCDLVLSDGEVAFGSVTDNWPTWEPWFLETGLNTPSIMSRQQQKELLELAVQSVQALGLKTGVMHVEAKYTSRGPRLIEVNCRMGGGPIRGLVLGVWGVDLVEEHLLTSAGIPSRPPAAPAPLAHLACWLANADKTGHMRGFECLDEWRRHPDVCYARPLVEPGAKVTGPADGLPTWVCELMVVKPTAQEAIDFIVKGIEARMEWPIDPLPPKVAAPAKA